MHKTFNGHGIVDLQMTTDKEPLTHLERRLCRPPCYLCKFCKTFVQSLSQFSTFFLLLVTECVAVMPERSGGHFGGAVMEPQLLS
jgi:hypothetical protein